MKSPSHPPAHPAQLQRLHRILLAQWWRRVGLLWLGVGSLSLWALRPELAMLQQHFTWSAVRYALAYNRPAALGLGLCWGLSVALLVAESRHLIWGLSALEQQQLEQQLTEIHRQGPRHPLWRLVCQPDADSPQ